MKKNSPSQLGFKIIALAVSLVVVFYFISELRSKNQAGPSDDALNALIGADAGRPLNWCPENVAQLQVESSPAQTITDSTQIQSLCQLLSQGFDSSKVDLQSFKPILRAIGSDKKETILEADSTGKVFRFQGLPFGSNSLSRELEKKFQR